MRTTVRLDPALLDQAKTLAARKGRTLTSLIDEGLRLVVGRSQPALERARVVLPSCAGDGLRPGVDLDEVGALAGPD